MLTVEQQLSIISRAWGDQEGWVFFPWISGTAPGGKARRKDWHELEGETFEWPRDRHRILSHMKRHKNDDLFWSCNLFEHPRRHLEYAMDQAALWADLDEVDPDSIETELKPSVAWETSPGRYQALWLLDQAYMGLSWHGNENHRLTAWLDADDGGWDTTQVLRIPGWRNHKAEYREDNNGPVPGRLVWNDPELRYTKDYFDEALPEIEKLHPDEIYEEDVDRIDRATLWEETRLKLPRAVRKLFEDKNQDPDDGDRSSTLWYMTRCLADIGLTTTEIVALTRESVWNKFGDRANELTYLIHEATKAIAQRSDETLKKLEEESREKPTPQKLFDLIRDVKTPEFLVRHFLARGSCGFIAGQPKSFKSWFGLDLACSVASGSPFLNEFLIPHGGPVLYVQEEDPLPMLKRRVTQVMAHKDSWLPRNVNGKVVNVPEPEPEIKAIVREGLVISDLSWQAWLSDQLEQGYDGDGEKPYALVILDPLMMVAGDVDDNKAQAMTSEIFRPLKQLAERFEVAIILVHHMRKGKSEETRGGQLMLGSVANHAWAECSLYLSLTDHTNEVEVHLENKYTVSRRFLVRHISSKTEWNPQVVDKTMADAPSSEFMLAENGERPPKKPRVLGNRALSTLQEMDGDDWISTKYLADVSGLTRDGVMKSLNRAVRDGLVDRQRVGRTVHWKLRG
jgi:AAA domain/RepB DNA-primase N-terminal domain